jgi:hypothetical protein
LAWVVGLSTLIITLLYKERADWLYLLATMGLSVLLLIVAFADLHGEQKEAGTLAAAGDSPPAPANIPATTQAAATAPSDWRGGKGRRK